MSNQTVFLPSAAYSAATDTYALTWVEPGLNGAHVATAAHPAGPWSVSSFLPLLLPPSSTIALWTDPATGTGYVRYNAAHGVPQPPMNVSGAPPPPGCDMTGYWYANCPAGGPWAWDFFAIEENGTGSFVPGRQPNYWASPWDEPLAMRGTADAATGRVTLSAPTSATGTLQAAGPGAPACSRVAWAAPLASCMWCRDPWCEGADVAPTAQAHVLEELTPNLLQPTGRYATILTRPARPYLEGGGMFAAGGKAYYVTGTDCCQCPQGSDAQAFAADSPLGEYRYAGQFNPPTTPTLPDCQDPPGCAGNFTVLAQPFGVVDAGDGAVPRLLYYGERYDSGGGGVGPTRYSGQFTTLLPLFVDAQGQAVPLVWQAAFNFTPAP